MAQTRTAPMVAEKYAPSILMGVAKNKDHSVEDDVHTIGDLAREFDVTLRALRFYEDKGLLSPKREGLTRLYNAQDREHLKLILKGKRLGFTLVEISEMIAKQGDKAPRLALSAEMVREQIA